MNENVSICPDGGGGRFLIWVGTMWARDIFMAVVVELSFSISSSSPFGDNKERRRWLGEWATNHFYPMPS